MNWFVRMASWARNPPSPMQVKILLAVLALALILVAVEQIWGLAGMVDGQQTPLMQLGAPSERAAGHSLRKPLCKPRCSANLHRFGSGRT